MRARGKDDLARKVLKGNIYGGKRRRGRPYLRRSDSIRQDARELLRILKTLVIPY